MAIKTPNFHRGVCFRKRPLSLIFCQFIYFIFQHACAAMCCPFDHDIGTGCYYYYHKKKRLLQNPQDGLHISQHQHQNSDDGGCWCVLISTNSAHSSSAATGGYDGDDSESGGGGGGDDEYPYPLRALK
jgi:hypothetical protein